ncbi:Nif3-like dinuclear metal center hexameric protein [Paenibacillus sp. PAMC21692]|uniref:Nif3-like dinuclear metal center hexameric protein n=1 Tax=Paenibacillus sp. PAMC21692 TaxID=2762320 RepID=UPI00164D8F96|nr:Nif3-like dinuclear metal center hexameric protein [Paenibacillus sp. PAMC21692]QNK55499.1 Nif3-like dinuclear metal center hexameric protein [Paenibacillus sp. PAMC21692]
MFANGNTVVQLMERLAPKYYAVENDKIGLQLGMLNKPISTIIVALDVTEQVVDEAIRAEADLIIAHHAIIYRPLAKLDTSTPAGKLYEKLIKHDIAVYISHTNLDVADGGINDWLADQAGILAEGRQSLDEVHTDQLYKLAVYVPETHHETVLNAILHAGAGHIGDYSHCSFNTKGVGTFMPGEGTSPHIGAQGKLERVDEVRIETIVPQTIQRKVVAAMLKAHPYEEVAYDLYRIELKGRSFGLGRAGKLAQPATLGELAAKLKQAFDVPMLRVVGDLDTPIRKAAVLGGSGGRYVRHAKFAGAEVLITGDIDYHTAHDAVADGMTIIDAGHNIEKVMKTKLAEWLSRELAEAKYATKVIPSVIHTEPFTFI